MPEPRLPRVFAVTAESLPSGVVLTPSSDYTFCLIKDLFGVLDEQPELLDDLLALYAEKKPEPDRHEPDQPSRDDLLAERLTAALAPASRQFRLQRPGALGLLDQLAHALGRGRWTGRRAA